MSRRKYTNRGQDTVTIDGTVPPPTDQSMMHNAIGGRGALRRDPNLSGVLFDDSISSPSSTTITGGIDINLSSLRRLGAVGGCGCGGSYQRRVGLFYYLVILMVALVHFQLSTSNKT